MLKYRKLSHRFNYNIRTKFREETWSSGQQKILSVYHANTATYRLRHKTQPQHPQAQKPPTGSNIHNSNHTYLERKFSLSL